jgi:hypothetical protein
MYMKSATLTSGVMKTFAMTLLLFTGFGGMAAGEVSAGDVAIKGYDSVAYFKAGKALKGSESFTFQWHNMTWFFLTRETGIYLRQVPGNTLRNMTAIAPGPLQRRGKRWPIRKYGRLLTESFTWIAALRRMTSGAKTFPVT